MSLKYSVSCRKMKICTYIYVCLCIYIYVCVWVCVAESLCHMAEINIGNQLYFNFFLKFSGVLGVSVGKESACDAGDEGGRGSVSGSGRSPAGENGNPLHYSCLENSMERGAWRVVVHGVTKSRTRLSD